ncbi:MULTISPECIES: conjugal transfer protein [unclassified Enterococcus]|uniref:conjugal transfer protein n=1 Tax=unclassified Enterococcus TaxID=2608891 RepID=UPI001905F599|nr:MULTISPECIES: conjugal transfer protein [unclassified Enterococcus]MBK0036047.1 conjugal transfer protein [Enterococcus sp. S52]MBK0068705.1 conjugal transfer protein [Enterococcus sp. S53]MBK0139298.1 conjugal transfer protein [Enterococcus sp. S76]MBK0142933.1 conjugal transfer protein [Enterococcus sp. S77]
MKLKFKRKEKNQKLKVPMAKKRVNSKFLAFFVWSLLGLWFVFNILSFVRMNGVVAINRDLHKEISQLKKSNLNENLLNQDSALDTFLRRFSTNYFNLTNDEQAMENRVNVLNNMSANGLTFEELRLPENQRQWLVNISTWKYQNFNSYGIATYNVTYRFSEDDRETSYSVAFNIPVMQDNDQFVVVSEPYISNFDINSLNGNGENLVTDSLRAEQITDRADVEQITGFVEQFLTIYQSGDLEQLKYLMNEPQGLNGEFEILLEDLKAFGLKDEPVVDLSVRLKQKDSNISYKQKMKLKLGLRDQKYFVEKFQQTLDQFNE